MGCRGGGRPTAESALKLHRCADPRAGDPAGRVYRRRDEAWPPTTTSSTIDPRNSWLALRRSSPITGPASSSSTTRSALPYHARILAGSGGGFCVQLQTGRCASSICRLAGAGFGHGTPTDSVTHRSARGPTALAAPPALSGVRPAPRYGRGRCGTGPRGAPRGVWGCMPWEHPAQPVPRARRVPRGGCRGLRPGRGA
jgi:hypothetical protein